MDKLKLGLICGISPFSAYLAQSSHQSLLSVLLLVNPFTVFLLISMMTSLTTSTAGHHDQSKTLRINLCDIQNGPERTNNKMAQRQSMDSHDGIPLTEYPLEMEERHVSDINGYSCSTQRNEGAHKVHNIYSYLILSFHLTLLWITRQNLVKTLQISSTELSLLYGAYILLLLLMWDIKHNRIISSNHLRATTNPGSIYLTLCNLLYLFVLLHYSYLNMTYSCATKPSAFGFMLLMPYECASLYDQDDYRARLSMFAALASGQLFFCHLVMLAYNSKDPRLSPLRQKIMLGL